MLSRTWALAGSAAGSAAGSSEHAARRSRNGACADTEQASGELPGRPEASKDWTIAVCGWEQTTHPTNSITMRGFVIRVILRAQAVARG